MDDAAGWAPGPSARSEVDPFIVMDVLARAQALEAEGRRIVHLEVGQPGTGAPEGARRALAAALEAGPLGYTAGLGLPALRARIAARYGERHGVDLDPARVVVTAGASGAFVLAFAALFEAGARVGLGVPGYPSYRAILKAMSCEAVPIPTRAEARFQPVPGDVAGLDGLIVASPANPTGTILGRSEMAALAAACRAERAALVSDEIYHGLTWGGEEVSALEVWDGGGDRELVLEVLLDDGLARGLAGGAAGTGADGGAAGAEPLHLRVPRGAGRGAGGDGVRRGAGVEPGGLRRQPGGRAGRAAGCGPRPLLAAGRGVLRLGGRLGHGPGQPGAGLRRCWRRRGWRRRRGRISIRSGAAGGCGCPMPARARTWRRAWRGSARGSARGSRGRTVPRTGEPVPASSAALRAPRPRGTRGRAAAPRRPAPAGAWCPARTRTRACTRT